MFPSKMMLCLTDPEDPIGFEATARLARQLNSALVLYHSRRMQFHEVSLSPPARYTKEAAALNALLRSEAASGLDASILTVDPCLDIVMETLDRAEKLGVDMLVTPTHSRSGVDRLLFGSITERFVHACRLPVLTFDLDRLSTQDDSSFDVVIVATDFSAISEAAIPVAAGIANQLGCPLHILHVVEDYYVTAYPMAGVPSVLDFQPSLTEAARQHMARTEQRAQTYAKTQLSTSVEVGRLVDHLRDHVALAKNPLIAMATAGRDSIGDWVLGSNTERALRTGKCSILALPPRFLVQ